MNASKERRCVNILILPASDFKKSHFKTHHNFQHLKILFAKHLDGDIFTTFLRIIIAYFYKLTKH